MIIGSKNFTNRQPFRVTEDDETKNWSGYCDGRRFRCALCGEHLKEGMTARWVYTNFKGSGVSGNPFVCGDCDEGDLEVIGRLRELKKEFNDKRFWWFRRRYDSER